MRDLIRVRMADYKLCSPPDMVTTLGLGSCMGVAIYSDEPRWCGLAHIMLPDSKKITFMDNRNKFADTCLMDMYQDLLLHTGVNAHFFAKIAGGAKMFAYDSNNELLNIGEQNYEAVHRFLTEQGIPIMAEDVGEDFSRTIVFDPLREMMHITAVGIKEYEI